MLVAVNKVTVHVV